MKTNRSLINLILLSLILLVLLHVGQAEPVAAQEPPDHLTAVSPSDLSFSSSPGDVLFEQEVTTTSSWETDRVDVELISKDWVQVSPTTRPDPGSFTISVDTTGLQPGVHKAVVWFKTWYSPPLPFHDEVFWAIL